MAPPTVDLQLDKKVAALQSAGQASLEKAQKGAAEDTVRMQAQAAKAQETIAATTGALGETVGGAVGAVAESADAVAAIKGAGARYTHTERARSHCGLRTGPGATSHMPRLPRHTHTDGARSHSGPQVPRER